MTLFVKHDPDRPVDQGQYHVLLADPMDPERGNRLGYWCDREHLRHMLVDLLRQFDGELADWILSRRTDAYVCVKCHVGRYDDPLGNFMRMLCPSCNRPENLHDTAENVVDTIRLYLNQRIKAAEKDVASHFSPMGDGYSVALGRLRGLKEARDLVSYPDEPF